MMKTAVICVFLLVAFVAVTEAIQHSNVNFDALRGKPAPKAAREHLKDEEKKDEAKPEEKKKEEPKPEGKPDAAKDGKTVPRETLTAMETQLLDQIKEKDQVIAEKDNALKLSSEKIEEMKGIIRHMSEQIQKTQVAMTKIARAASKDQVSNIGQNFRGNTKTASEEEAEARKILAERKAATLRSEAEAKQKEAKAAVEQAEQARALAAAKEKEAKNALDNAAKPDDVVVPTPTPKPEAKGTPGPKPDTEKLRTGAKNPIVYTAGVPTTTTYVAPTTTTYVAPTTTTTTYVNRPTTTITAANNLITTFPRVAANTFNVASVWKEDVIEDSAMIAWKVNFVQPPPVDSYLRYQVKCVPHTVVTQREVWTTTQKDAVVGYGIGFADIYAPTSQTVVKGMVTGLNANTKYDCRVAYSIDNGIRYTWTPTVINIAT
eukprot:GFYU01001846.1.p1 GENE.GFYU01001846.1~~GFYU01001846.1.p1  ORF type:complete len:432 (-),score=188.46 GFYU01001846.1:303-1598(-)